LVRRVPKRLGGTRERSCLSLFSIGAAAVGATWKVMEEIVYALEVVSQRDRLLRFMGDKNSPP
jgi:hypothetical protein